MADKEQPPYNPHVSAPPEATFEPPPPYTPMDEGKFHQGAVTGQQSYPGQHPAAGAYPPQNYPPPQQAPVTTVIVNSIPSVLGPYPVNCQCPKCNSHIVTSTGAVPGVITWLIAFLCVLFGCWFGCCLIPFCSSSMQNVEHRCPQCKYFLGVYRRL